MKARIHLRRLSVVSAGLSALAVAALAAVVVLDQDARAGWSWKASRHPPVEASHPCGDLEGAACAEWAGSWYWLRSPEQERRVTMSRYNRYCIRCHGVDGRGVWDIPDVPDFTNARWQASRSDAQLTRLILEGRGAVMPAFRGTLSLEEAWSMTRYLRTFIPGTAPSRPDLRDPAEPADAAPAPPKP